MDIITSKHQRIMRAVAVTTVTVLILSTSVLGSDRSVAWAESERQQAQSPILTWTGKTAGKADPIWSHSQVHQNWINIANGVAQFTKNAQAIFDSVGKDELTINIHKDGVEPSRISILGTGTDAAYVFQGGPIKGSVDLFVGPKGALIIRDNNTFDGTTRLVPSGSISLNSETPLGKSRFRVEGGLIGNDGLQERSLSNPVTFAIPEGADAQFQGASLDLQGTADLAGMNTLSLAMSDGARALTFSGVVQDDPNTKGKQGKLIINGFGMLVLKGKNTYTGGTVVNGNVSLLAKTPKPDSATGNGPVEVKDDGVIFGDGNVDGLVILRDGALIAPGDTAGNAAGLLSIGILDLNFGSILSVDLNGLQVAKEYDQLVVQNANSIFLRGFLEVKLDSNAFKPAKGQRFVIIRNKGGGKISGGFNNLERGNILRVETNDQSMEIAFKVSYTGTDENGQGTNNVVLEIVNISPEKEEVGDKEVNEGQALNFANPATDSDGDKLAYSLVNAPAGATIDSASGEFSWTP
ncbi:MAG: hypothetical protein MN733_11165, partial [Nitrososphaera sp.]|nr:hypothetical protein [Nitrososphaera sp.]